MNNVLDMTTPELRRWVAKTLVSIENAMMEGHNGHSKKGEKLAARYNLIRRELIARDPDTWVKCAKDNGVNPNAYGGTIFTKKIKAWELKDHFE